MRFIKLNGDASREAVRNHQHDLYIEGVVGCGEEVRELERMPLKILYGIKICQKLLDDPKGRVEEDQFAETLREKDPNDFDELDYRHAFSQVHQVVYDVTTQD